MSNPETNPNRPTLNIRIDKSDIEKEQAEKIEALTRENQTQQETIKNMLVDHKAKFDLENTNHMGIKVAPTNSESPPLEAPRKKEIQLIDLEDSFIPEDFVRGKNPQEVLEKIEMLSRSKAENSDTYKKILSKVIKRTFEGQKSLDITFSGSSKDFMRSPLPINDNLPLETQERIKQRNEKLRNNRLNWKVN